MIFKLKEIPNLTIEHSHLTDSQVLRITTFSMKNKLRTLIISMGHLERLLNTNYEKKLLFKLLLLMVLGQMGEYLSTNLQIKISKYKSKSKSKSTLN
jgi:hypothetical protein